MKMMTDKQFERIKFERNTDVYIDYLTTGLSVQDIADKYGIGNSATRNIIKYVHRWRTLDRKKIRPKTKDEKMRPSGLRVRCEILQGLENVKEIQMVADYYERLLSEGEILDKYGFPHEQWGWEFGENVSPIINKQIRQMKKDIANGVEPKFKFAVERS